MAIEAFRSVQYASTYRKRPTDEHGKLRFLNPRFGPLTVAGDDGSTFELDIASGTPSLPPGAVRIIPALSRFANSAFGAARVMKMGYKQYRNADDRATVGSGLIAADDDAFQANVDISAALTNQVLGTALHYDVYSKAGVSLFATVTGGTSPVDATIEWLIAYIYE